MSHKAEKSVIIVDDEEFILDWLGNAFDDEGISSIGTPLLPDIDTVKLFAAALIVDLHSTGNGFLSLGREKANAFEDLPSVRWAMRLHRAQEQEGINKSPIVFYSGDTNLRISTLPVATSFLSKPGEFDILLEAFERLSPGALDTARFTY